jgi:hypothetical protein
LIENVSKVGLRAHDEVDHRNIDRGLLELQAMEILRVLFGGDQGICAGLLGYLSDLGDILGSIAAVIGIESVPAKRQAPSLQIAQKGAGIAKTTKGKKGSAAYFRSLLQMDFTTEPPESQKSCGCGKNGKLGELANSLIYSRHGLSPGEDNDIRPAHGGKGFSKRAGGKQGLAVQRPRCIHQEDVEISREFQVLEAVVEKKNVDGFA